MNPAPPALQPPPPLAPRVSLGDAALVAPEASVVSSLLSRWGIGSTSRSTSTSQVNLAPQSRPAAAIDVERLNDRGLDGRLAQAALQLAFERPGQTIELDLVLGHSGATSGDLAGIRPDRTLSLRYQPGSGVTLNTSAPSAGGISFGIRELPVSSGTADSIAGLLDRVSSLSKFTVIRANVDPPPVSTGLPGPGPVSSLTPKEQSLIGVARWPGRDYNSENDKEQQAYGRAFATATSDAGSQLSEGRIRSLKELWTYAQDWRGSTVSDTDHKDFGLGSQRRNDLVQTADMTPLTGPYSYIRDRYKERTDGSVEYPERVSMRYPITDSIDGKRIALSSVSIRTQWDEASAKKYLAGRHDEGASSDELPPFRINHTSVGNSQRIMAHAESLFERALDPEISRSETLTTLGELHWWMSHAMPDTRGSAAKAELSVRALAQARGMELPPFKQGFVPDLEAITRSRTDFVHDYANSFSRPPL